MSFENSTAEEIQKTYEDDYKRTANKYLPWIIALPFIFCNIVLYLFSLATGKPITLIIYINGLLVSLIMSAGFFVMFISGLKPHKDDGQKLRELLDLREQEKNKSTE